MPRLWAATVATHRQEVQRAIVDAVGDLVRDRGLLAVTMTQVAETTGIGRATLYKYFSDVDEVLGAWLERRIQAHLDELASIRDGPGEPAARLRQVLETYARTSRRGHHEGAEDVAAALHRRAQVQRLRTDLLELVAGLIAEASEAGVVRADVPPFELAAYSVHALAAAEGLSSAAARSRLVELVWTALTQQMPSGIGPADAPPRRRAGLAVDRAASRGRPPR